MNLFAYQLKATDAATQATAGEKPLIEEKKKDAPVVKAADIKDWEGVKTMPAPPDSIQLEGHNWVLIDQITVLDKDSEEKHALVITDAKDTYRSRQKLKYPDGTTVEDTGRAHVGGFAQYKILNVAPGRPLVVLRRMDYVYGDYELELYVNGKSAGVISCAGTDRANRWRNWPYLIKEEFVTDNTLTIKQVSLTAGRDVNMFHYWFYQPK